METSAYTNNSSNMTTNATASFSPPSSPPSNRKGRLRAAKSFDDPTTMRSSEAANDYGYGYNDDSHGGGGVDYGYSSNGYGLGAIGEGIQHLDGQQETTEVFVPRRRVNRRASTGGFNPSRITTPYGYNTNTTAMGGNSGHSGSSNDYHGPRSTPSTPGGSSNMVDYGYGDDSIGAYSSHRGGTNNSLTGGSLHSHSEANSASLFERAMRRGSMSKQESQRMLSETLSRVDGYKDFDADRDDKLQMLKDRFASPNKPNLKPAPRRMKRRSSLSSYASQGSASIAYPPSTADTSDAYGYIPQTPSSIPATLSSISATTPSSSGGSLRRSRSGEFLRDSNMSAMSMDNMSIDILNQSSKATNLTYSGNHHGNNINNSRSHDSSTFNMSTVTVPANNTAKHTLEQNILNIKNNNNNSMSTNNNNVHDVSLHSEMSRRHQQHKTAKTEQIVESLVWFSFHTPRAVLEDLITHELELWRHDAKKFERKEAREARKQRKNNRMNNSASNITGVASKSPCPRSKRTASGGGALGGTGAGQQHNDVKMSYMMRNDDDDDDTDFEDDFDDTDDGQSTLESATSGSVSSLSDHDPTAGANSAGLDNVFDGNFSEFILRQQGLANSSKMIKLPKCIKRESALLFVDMSGFTKLSTLLDVESLSKVINSYFDMIVSEVLQYGGDILKFAGDAFFAEWKVIDDDKDHSESSHQVAANPLAELNASLASINDMRYDTEDIPKLSTCVLAAAKCAASIVEKFSDYQVMTAANTSEAMLNVHCGVGCGHLVGLHVGDYKAGEDEEGEIELRREFLILGSPIDQVSKAADIASDGEVMCSPEAITSLAFCCDLTDEQRYSNEPVIIASRDEVLFSVIPELMSMQPSSIGIIGSVVGGVSGPLGGLGGAAAALQPYESLRMHCKALNHAALARLHLQMALYVHPVIRGDELALSAAILAGKIIQPTEALESRHRAEAELRSVLTIFIKAVMSPRITGLNEVDEELFQKLCDIMHVTARELDRYSGHLRQFIVDDKGVVLIATFGLRGSTFPNMISNNGLPAVFAIHRALKQELGVENRIGATFGKAYCGVVGGIRRHEFAVMGAPVNLAARLMASKVNKGILVDEAVRDQADARYAFNSLPPVEAKGYDHPVAILEPIENHVGSKRKKWASLPFVGRSLERETISNVAKTILNSPEHAQITMIFLMGESGMGKSSLAMAVLEDVKKHNSRETESNSSSSKTIICARSTSTETQQRIPLSSYRKVFQSIVREFCEYDGTLSFADDGRSVTSSSTTNHSTSNSASTPITPRFARFRGMANHYGNEDQSGDRPSLTRVRGTRGVTTPPQGISNSMADVSAGFYKKTGEAEKKGAALSGATRSVSLHGDALKGGKRDGLTSSLHRHPTPKPMQKESLGQSLHRISSTTLSRSTSLGNQTMPSPTRSSRRRVTLGTPRDDSSIASGSVDASAIAGMKHSATVPFFEKLCWVCEELDYPFEYADIVGSQFLGLDGASPVTHVDGHVPTMDELSEFLALAFICLTEYADLTVVVLDDFQWVDAFSWKIFQVLGKKAQKLLLICAARSHDKQALRRLSSAASGQNQLQAKMIEISLGPFDFMEIRQLSSKVLGCQEESITDGLCTDIFQRTGGLPVYVIQVLENIKRKKSLEPDEDGVLQWTAEGLREKRAIASNKTGVVMEETFLSRFDTLDVRVRKVLQTCAVLGLSFSLSDVVQVHPEMDEVDIENALEIAVDEMILVEHIDEDDESMSLKTDTTGDTDSNAHSFAADRSRVDSKSGSKSLADRYFQFSHAMWRQNVLTTMLKERKIELHRLIAEAMEKDEVLVLEQSDISRLLTLFDHWKSCGDFCKTAPLALAVGARLEEWDLCAQSLELYEDALEMSFDTVQRVEADVDSNEWVQVAAQPAVLDYILRLHIRIGLCHQNLGEDQESICMFEDAYNIIKTSSKVPSTSRALMMPIISSLCVLKLDQTAYDTRTKLEQEKLAEKFVKEAIENGNPVHIGRALAMEANHYAKMGDLQRAFASLEKLKEMYDVQANSFEMIAEYGRDFALECYSESVQWYYLEEKEEEAEAQADMIIQDFLPLLAPVDSDIAMYAVLPVIQVLRLIGRARDSEDLLRQYIIEPYQDSGSLAGFWAPLFNPLAYLLELIVMEETDQEDPNVLQDMEEWALDEDNYHYSMELERKANTICGEICWRLLMYKEEGDPSRAILAAKARELLTPIASYPHPEVFLKRTAEALLEAL